MIQFLKLLRTITSSLLLATLSPWLQCRPNANLGGEVTMHESATVDIFETLRDVTRQTDTHGPWQFTWLISYELLQVPSIHKLTTTQKCITLFYTVWFKWLSQCYHTQTQAVFCESIALLRLTPINYTQIMPVVQTFFAFSQNTLCNLGGTWRRICSPDTRGDSALEVLRNCAL